MINIFYCSVVLTFHPLFHLFPANGLKLLIFASLCCWQYWISFSYHKLTQPYGKAYLLHSMKYGLFYVGTVSCSHTYRTVEPVCYFKICCALLIVFFCCIYSGVYMSVLLKMHMIEKYLKLVGVSKCTFGGKYKPCYINYIRCAFNM